ncbi:MAG: patatin-like phospholipase family protein [Proteobacteria bacterium]|nr:patatin-like phospholipase family protein [Pseudomonadota bacterium]
MKKIGLALSGGGIRAYAHLGFLSNLEWAKIPVSLISGSSVGAVIGAYYSAGLNLDILKNRLKEIGFLNIFSFILPFYGLSSFKKVANLFSKLGIPESFEELKIPLIVSATDLKKRAPVYFNSGSLWSALFASMALPGVFSPIKMGEMYLVDGGISVNLPVSVLKENGADFVVAVDVNSSSRKFPVITNIYQVVYESVTLMVQRTTEQERASADFLIDIDLEGIGFLDFKKREEVINYSYKNSYQKVLELKKNLEEKGYVQSGGMGSLFVSSLP